MSFLLCTSGSFSQHQNKNAEEEVKTPQASELDRPYDYSSYLPSLRPFSGNEKELPRFIRDFTMKRMKDAHEQRAELEKKGFDGHGETSFYTDVERIWESLSSTEFFAYRKWKKWCEADPSFCTRSEFKKWRKLLERLSFADLAHLVDYLEDSYQATNEFLWSPSDYHNQVFEEEKEHGMESFLEQMKLMEAPLVGTAVALNQLDSHPKGQTLYRCDVATAGGEEAPSYVQDFFREEQKGKLTLFRGFKSTTKGVGSRARERFVEDCPYLRVIETSAQSRGRDVTHFSPRSHEEEVLFLPNTYFKVRDYQEVKRKRIEFDPETGKEREVEYTQKIMYMKECVSPADCD